MLTSHFPLSPHLLSIAAFRRISALFLITMLPTKICLKPYAFSYRETILIFIERQAIFVTILIFIEKGCQ